MRSDRRERASAAVASSRISRAPPAPRPGSRRVLEEQRHQADDAAVGDERHRDGQVATPLGRPREERIVGPGELLPFQSEGLAIPHELPDEPLNRYGALPEFLRPNPVATDAMEEGVDRVGTHSSAVGSCRFRAPVRRPGGGLREGFADRELREGRDRRGNLGPFRIDSFGVLRMRLSRFR